MRPTNAPPPHPVARRALLLGATAALTATAGCSDTTTGSTTGTTTGTTPADPAKSTPAATPTPTPSATATFPRTTPWRPTSAENEPKAKLRAVQLVEALGAWRSGGSGKAAARTRVTALHLPAALADQAGALLPAADEAVVQVVDAQYGGLLTDTASVLVVCRQWTRRGSTVTAGGTTVDVRLRRTSGSVWTVTALHPADPGPARKPEAKDVREVLAASRLTLPPAAEADVRSGRVHATVLDTMLGLARTYRVGISVIRSGHPLDVFGTTRPSDHPQGRAFDVWRIDGHPVVDPDTPRTLIEGFMRAAAAAGSYNVGGPIHLSGGTTPNQFFSDATHHDHVHVGFRT
ncbi:hypothetical protein [Streptomyces sp. NPDC087294]|uniref:hypothetical protein n=1 Tax=Streptomyces sp. NPDC087294 TaxID=3365777 RepID=UPI003811A898